MGRFGRSDAPRVVGFDFSAPPAPTPWMDAAAPPAPPAPPVVEAPVSYDAPPVYDPPPASAPPVYEAPVAEAPPAYAPPAYAPPAYAPPVYAEPVAAPVATLAPSAYAAPAPAPWETPQAAFPPAPSWAPPQPQRASRVSRTTLRTGASVLLAVGLLAGRVYLRTSGDDAPAGALRTPAVVGGEPRLTSDAAKSLESQALGALPGVRQPVVGLYGSGAPTYVLVAGAGGSHTAADDALRSFSNGFASSGGTVSAPKQMAGGLACARMSAGAMRGAVCAWSSGVSTGVVMQYVGTDVTTLAKATVQARAAVNGG